MITTQEDALEKLKSDMAQDMYEAWQQFGSTTLRDPQMFSKFTQMQSICKIGDFHFRAGRVLTPDTVFPESQRIRMGKVIPDPDLNFLCGNVGFGNRESPCPTAFYHINNLELQERDYYPEDQVWLSYLPNGDIITENAYWLSILANCTRACNNIAYLNPDAKYGVFVHTNNFTKIENPIVPVIGRRSYFHFMIDQLPFVLLAQHITPLKKLPIGFIRTYKTQLETCKAYGANTDSIIELEKITGRKNPNTFVFKEAYHPAFIPLPARLTLLRSVIGAKKLPKGTSKIFVCRKPAPMVPPRLENQQQLEDVLSANGFTIMYCEDYSVAEQKEIFSKAKIVVGAHGAGLTNIMFSPVKTLLIEIMNEVSDQNPMGHCDCFRRICASNGQSYIRLVCPVSPDSPRCREQDLHMNCAPERILNLVSAASDALEL